MSDWRDDLRWTNRFLPQIRRILAQFLGLSPHLVDVASYEDDALRNTDLIVLNAGGLRIACRVRRHKFLVDYPDDLTVRADRPSGNKSELEKLREGFGDWIFYGFCDKSETVLLKWRLAHLDYLRADLEWHEDHRLEFGSFHHNTDGSSNFYSWHRTDLVPFFYEAESTSTTDDN